MRKIFIITSILLGFSPLIYAQLTIEYCQTKAKANYPLIRQYDLIEKAKEYNLSNAGKGYLPQLSLSAKASYQSDVTTIPISVPGVKGLDKDQYSVSVDLNQTIWDGGTIDAKKQQSETAANVSRQELEVGLYTINDRVNQLFFGILLLDAKLEQNQLFGDELGRNHKLISSYIQNGIANQADLDAIRVEQLKTKQNSIQLQSNRKAYADMLSTLIGEPIGSNQALTKPDAPDMLTSADIDRPELQLYDAQHKNMETQKKMIAAANMPKLGLFVTGGYGKPGLNMLESKFDMYYIGGVRLSWNFGNLYTKKNDHRLIEVNQNSIATQRETFLFNLKMEISQEQREIEKNKDLLQCDNEIITLRNNVKKATEAKVANGTMTVIDLMREINAEELAKQDKIRHEIEFLLSIYNLKFTTNK